MVEKRCEIVALTAWENRISPVFNSSRTLYIVQLSDGKIVQRSLESFNPEIRWHLVERLNTLEIDTLICGAVSGGLANIITSCDIELIPFISGRIDDVLEVYLRENSVTTDFLMPGCGRRCRNRLCESNIGNPVAEVNAMNKRSGQLPNDRGRGQGQGQGKRRDGSGMGQGRNQGGQGRGRGQCSGGKKGGK